MAYRTDTSSIRPENALKRAEELVAVGQPLPALQVLFDVLTNRKFKVWSKPLEDIMMKVSATKAIGPESVLSVRLESANLVFNSCIDDI